MKKIVFEQDKQNYIPADFEVINLSKVNIICMSPTELPPNKGGIEDMNPGLGDGEEDDF